MRILRQNKNWLRYRVKSYLKEHHKELYPSRLKIFQRTVKQFIQSPKSWIFILPVLIIVFSFGIFSFLNLVELDKDIAGLLIDKRIGNVTAITSISLVIIGFLISNIATKEPYAYQQLFKRSYLYPVLYFTLSVIAILFLISIFRDTVSDSFFVNSVIIGTYLGVIILFLIAILFNTIIRFTDSKYIWKIFEKDLVEEERKYIKAILLQKYSTEIFRNEMLRMKGKEYSFLSSLSFNKNDIDIIEVENEVYEHLVDVNLKKLRKIISVETKKDNKIVFTSIEFGKAFKKNEEIVWNEGNTGQNKSSKYRKCFKLHRKDKQIIIPPIRVHFDEIFDALIRKNEYHKLESFIVTYYELYKLHAEQLKSFIGNENQIFKNIEKSIENNQKDTVNTLTGFIRKVLSLSLHTKSLNLFEQFIKFINYLYEVSYFRVNENAALKPVYRLCSEKSLRALTDIIRFYIPHKKETIKDIEEQKWLNRIYEHTFISFSNYLYNTIRNRDINHFEKAIKSYINLYNSIPKSSFELEYKISELNNADQRDTVEIDKLQTEFDEDKKPEKYYRHLLAGLNSWIIYLYQIDNIDKDFALRLLTQFKTCHTSFEFTLPDILTFRGRFNFDYLGWRNWDYTERPEWNFYTPPDPFKWLTFGYFINIIKQNSLIFTNENLSHNQLNAVPFLLDDIKKYSNEIEGDFEKWSTILNINSKDEYCKIKEDFLSNFAKLKRTKIGIDEQEIASTSISLTAIDKFKETVGKAWEKSSVINSLFQSKSNIKIEERGFKFIGYSTIFEKAKTMFIEGKHYNDIYGIDNFGRNVAEIDDSVFFDTITKKANVVEEVSLIKVLNKAIHELKDNEIIPDIILVSSGFAMNERLLSESKLFVARYKEKNKDKVLSPFYLGKFDNIPVYGTFSNRLSQSVVVCNFANSFKMKYNKNKIWYKNIFDIQVEEISKNRAESILEKQPSKWKITDEKIEISDEDAITSIQTSVFIKLGTYKQYEIIDEKSYIHGIINEKI